MWGEKLVVEHWLVYLLKGKVRSLCGVHTCSCTRALPRLYEWGCWVAPPTCEFNLCLRCQLWSSVHCWYLHHKGLWGSQLCSDVRCLRLWMLDEQRATKSCWCWNLVNKVYWKSKVASNSSCILLERDPCLRRATDSCNWSWASQTDGYNGISSPFQSNHAYCVVT